MWYGFYCYTPFVMKNTAVAAVGEKLALQCIGLSREIPKWILDEQPVPPWLSLSVTTVYLSFAKHWLSLLCTPAIWKSVVRHMDDCFFELVEHTDFEVNVSDVLVQPAEREAFCKYFSETITADFEYGISSTRTLLNIVFADRCNQYFADLREGFIMKLEGKQNILGPVIFVYKRFNQHVFGIECDARTVDLDDHLKYLMPFDSIFLSACNTLQQSCADLKQVLPPEL